MATHRYISTSFWDDAWIQELDPSEKFVYLYLMTNPLTSISGVYKVTDRRISFDTGYDVATIKKILDRFADVNKAIRIDEWVILPTWPKHQNWETMPKIKQGIISELQNLPIEIFDKLEDFGYRFDLALVNYKHGKTKEKKNTQEAIKDSDRPPVNDDSLLEPIKDSDRLSIDHDSLSIDSDRLSIESELLNSNSIKFKFNTHTNSESESVCEKTSAALFISLWQNNGDIFNPLARIKSPKDWEAYWREVDIPPPQVEAAVKNFCDAIRQGLIERRFIPGSPDTFVLNGWLQKSQEPYKKQGKTKKRLDADGIDDVGQYFKEA